jgi:hypothetical protein
VRDIGRRTPIKFRNGDFLGGPLTKKPRRGRRGSVEPRECPAHVANAGHGLNARWLLGVAGGGQESARLLALILASPRQRTAERADNGCVDPTAGIA